MFKLTTQEAIELQAFLLTLNSNLSVYRKAIVQRKPEIENAMKQCLTLTPELEKLAKNLTVYLDNKSGEYLAEIRAKNECEDTANTVALS